MKYKVFVWKVNCLFLFYFKIFDKSNEIDGYLCFKWNYFIFYILFKNKKRIVVDGLVIMIFIRFYFFDFK